MLIVNTASKCGFTPQFEGLEKLYEEFNESGLEILGFPCNQFKEQDPGTNEEIKNFCLLNYGVSFQMFDKVDVNGTNRHPLFEYIIANSPNKTNKAVRWNFEKFLVDKEGKVVKRYPSTKTPKSLKKDITELF